MAALVGNDLEKLRDDRAGQCSSRVNKQWCVCFVWRDGDAERVELCDDHRGRLTMLILREDIENGLVDLSDEGDELLPAVHPGEHVRDRLAQTGVTAYALAQATKVPQTRIAEILAGRRGITVDTAVRLGRAIGTGAEMWIGLQTSYELELARRKHVGEDVERIAA